MKTNFHVWLNWSNSKTILISVSVNQQQSEKYWDWKNRYKLNLKTRNKKYKWEKSTLCCQHVRMRMNNSLMSSQFVKIVQCKLTYRLNISEKEWVKREKHRRIKSKYKVQSCFTLLNKETIASLLKTKMILTIKCH